MLQEFLSPHGALTLHGVYVWIFTVSIPLSCTIQGMTECEDRDVSGIAFMHARALWEPVNYLQLSLVFIQVIYKTGLTASCSLVKMLSTLTRSTPGVSKSARNDTQQTRFDTVEIKLFSEDQFGNLARDPVRVTLPTMLRRLKDSLEIVEIGNLL